MPDAVVPFSSFPLEVLPPPSPLLYALRQVARHEQGGPNLGPIVEESLALWTGRPTMSAAWCAGFLSTGLVAGGALGALTVGHLSAEQLWKNLRACWVKDTPPAPLPGDVAWFRRADGGWHVGFIAAVVSPFPDLRIQTIEGNSHNQVNVRTVAWRDAKIIGLARPILIGICGALPPECGPIAPCAQPAGHVGPCDSPRQLGPDLGLAVSLVRIGHPQQGRALRFMRGRMSVEACAERFRTTPETWQQLEYGRAFIDPESFARICRGLIVTT